MSARWQICPCCKGEGRTDSLGVVNPDDFSPDEWDDYMAGRHSTPCGLCGTSGKVLTEAPGIVCHMPDGTVRGYADADAASERFMELM